MTGLAARLWAIAAELDAHAGVAASAVRRIAWREAAGHVERAARLVDLLVGGPPPAAPKPSAP